VAHAAPREVWLGPRALTALVAGSMVVSQTVGGLFGAVEPALNLRVFDMGTFLLWLWVVLVPYYVVRREGWRGVWRVALFVLAYLLAGVVGRVLPRIALAVTVGG
jgi:hypothetical protein